MSKARTLLLLIILLLMHDAYASPSFQDVKDSFRKSDAVLLDRHGKVIHELRVDPKGRRLDWVSIEAISPSMIRAVLKSEDKRFYEHTGFDWIAFGSAVMSHLFTKQSRGASTITMQLASFLDERLKPKGRKRTLGQKWDQIKAARELEETWSKKEILEAYLNLLTFRGELQGISAASRGLFDKDPAGLDESESLLLAALIRSPNAPAGKVSKRACLLREAMNYPVGCEEIKRLADETLSRKYSVNQRRALAPHVAYKLLPVTPGKYPVPNREQEGLAVASALDGDLQRFTVQVLKQHIMSVRQQNVSDGAVLIADNRTGDVLAYVAGVDGESGTRFVDGVKAKRQAGSTLKPFLYAIALEKRILTPASLLNDSPVEISTALGIYKPENYENDFKGMVSVRAALASSLNVPAVRTLTLIGVESFIQKLGQLGFDRLKADDYYGFSLALGSVDVSLWELVNAYRTLANQGVWTGLSLTPSADRGQSRLVFSGETTFLISDILSDREARSYTFNLENPLSARFWTAVKTGTSKDMRDNWCIGYSQKYTVGVWVGNFSGAPMWNVTGITGAAPVWLDIMNYLHRENPGRPPRPPAGVLARKIEFQEGTEPGRVEFFLKNTEPAGPANEKGAFSFAETYDLPQIIYPSHKAIISLDPDIPEENQVLFFMAKTSAADFRWALNGKEMGTAQTQIPWRPEQGKYALSLLDKQSHVIDSVEFEVRGAMHDYH